MNKETLVGKRARIKQGSYGQFAARDYVGREGTIVADHRYVTGISLDRSGKPRKPFPLCLKLDIEGCHIGVREEWLEILEK